MTGRAPLFALVLILAGCAGANVSARKHLQAGRYEAALSAYEQILAADPRDASALEGRRLARQGSLSQRLIAVRMARLSQNRQAALETLRQVVEDQRRWQVIPTGAEFTTQREETGEAFKYFTDVINGHLEAKHPVPARLFFERYSAIFSQPDALEQASAVRRRIDAGGQQTCAALAKQVPKDSLYFRGFIESYCRYWAVDAPLRGRAPNDPPDAFGSVSLECNVSNLPVEPQYVRELLNRALRSSPFYDARSKHTLFVELHGQFRQALIETPETLEHSYEVKEPYTDYEKVKKTRHVAYDEVVQVSSEPVRMEKVRRDKVEEYEETEPVTKTRSVVKIHRFLGRRYHQELILLANGQVDFGSRKLDLSVYEADHREGVAHDVELPSIGLYRRPDDLIHAPSWFTGKAEQLQARFADKLDSLWFDLNCGPAAQGAESVHKCQRARRSKDAELVVSWFKSNLGVSSEEMVTAMSK